MINESQKTGLYVTGLLLAAGVPLLVGRSLIATISGHYHLAVSATPYLVPDYAGWLYLLGPLIVLSSLVLVMAPGLLLTLALKAAGSVAQWVLVGLGVSIVVTSGTAGVMQAIMGRPLSGGGFTVVLLGLTAVSGGFLILRLGRGWQPEWPWRQPFARTTMLSLLLVPTLALIVLVPKFYWENFNGDGAHAFESARLLLRQPFPFWPDSAGAIAGFPGMTSMLFLYPVSWFIRLFGEVEVAARLPFLLFWAGLFAGIVALVDFQRKEKIRPVTQWLIWLGLAVYAATMAFSASYSPYMADIALPATQDTLQVALFLGFVLAFLQQRWLWTLFFVGLTLYCSPNGLLLIGFWIVAVSLTERPVPWRWLLWTGGSAAAFLVAAAMMTPLMSWLGQPVPGGEYDSSGLLRRLTYVTVVDWRRILYLLIPSGIVPGLALLAWRWQDRVARMLTLVTAAYFGFFFIQGSISLHHFSPVMVLPLVVLWRTADRLPAPSKRWLWPVTAAAGVGALFLSLPADFTPHTTARQVGATIEFRVAGYARSRPQVFRGAELLNELFPAGWATAVPTERYGGSPLPWTYYAHQPRADETAMNYLLQSVEDAPPLGMSLAASSGGFSLYVADTSAWERDRRLRPSTGTISAVYRIHKSTLYRGVPVTDGPPIIDVRAALCRLRE